MTTGKIDFQELARQHRDLDDNFQKLLQSRPADRKDLREWQDQVEASASAIGRLFTTISRTPEYKAREALQLGLTELASNPAIMESQTCKDLLNIFCGCLFFRDLHEDAWEILRPLDKGYASEHGRLIRKARTEKNTGPRQWVQNKWATEKDGYNGNKSVFARDVIPQVKRIFTVDVTQQTICRSWLK